MFQDDNIQPEASGLKLLFYCHFPSYSCKGFLIKISFKPARKPHWAYCGLAVVIRKQDLNLISPIKVFLMFALLMNQFSYQSAL